MPQDYKIIMMSYNIYDIIYYFFSFKKYFNFIKYQEYTTKINFNFIKYQEWFIGIGSHFWGRITRMAILLGAAAIGYLIVSFALNNFPRLSELKKNR